MRHELSILIPAYNQACTELVKALLDQAIDVEGLYFEIIVAEDGSTDEGALEANQLIGGMEDCRYLHRKENVGRAGIRNFLAREARYAWLLFIDSDLCVTRDDFLENYLETEAEVVYGGYTLIGEMSQEKGNLRYLYERHTLKEQSAALRQQRPYRDFHTSNFLVGKDFFLRHPLDERFVHYGYEDVLWGKTLEQQGVTIAHIDNPMGFCRFEDNAQFLHKTEEGLRTLKTFAQELQGYSRLLATAKKIRRCHLTSLVRTWHQIFGCLERANLTGRHPSLLVFKYYKLGYFMSIRKSR